TLLPRPSRDPRGSLNSRGPSESRTATVRRVPQNASDLRRIPLSSPCGRNSALPEPSCYGVHRHLLFNVAPKNLAHYSRFRLQDLIARLRISRLSNVPVAVRRPRENANRPGPGAMHLAPPAPLSNLSSFILSDHALKL